MEEQKLVRLCPECKKEIFYSRKSDYTKAIKRNSLCKSCAVKKSSIFKKGHTLNDNVVRNNSLDKLIKEKTLQSFYWIGFILADGCFYKNKFELGLAKKDLEVLESFSNYINYKNKIMYRENTNSYRISFSNSKSIPEFMKEYNISYRKTYNPVNFDKFNKNYSEDLLYALLIGIIDGDGNIQNNGSPNANVITITFHKNWINFYEKLLDFLDIPKHISLRKNSNTCVIRIYNKEIINRFVNLIIENNLFYIKRKWNIIIKDPA